MRRIKRTPSMQANTKMLRSALWRTREGGRSKTASSFQSGFSKYSQKNHPTGCATQNCLEQTPPSPWGGDPAFDTQI
jgi:hypothetical protein